MVCRDILRVTSVPTLKGDKASADQAATSASDAHPTWPLAHL